MNTSEGPTHISFPQYVVLPVPLVPITQMPREFYLTVQQSKQRSPSFHGKEVENRSPIRAHAFAESIDLETWNTNRFETPSTRKILW